jgi:hypothetical protein
MAFHDGAQADAGARQPRHQGTDRDLKRPGGCALLAFVFGAGIGLALGPFASRPAGQLLLGRGGLWRWAGAVLRCLHWGIGRMGWACEGLIKRFHPTGRHAEFGVKPREQRIKAFVPGEHNRWVFLACSIMRPSSKAMWKSRALGPVPLARAARRRLGLLGGLSPQPRTLIFFPSPIHFYLGLGKIRQRLPEAIRTRWYE